MPVNGSDELKRTNEIGMAIPVLEPIDLAGTTVTADALLAQRKLTTYRVERDAHDLFVVKDSQPALSADIRPHFAARGAPDFREPTTLHRGPSLHLRLELGRGSRHRALRPWTGEYRRPAALRRRVVQGQEQRERRGYPR